MSYSKKNYKKQKSLSAIPILLLGLGLYKLTKNNTYIILFIVLPLIFSILNFIMEYYFELKKQEKYLNSGINIVDNLSGIEFEEYLLAHFIKLGYKGTLTPKTNDYGADLILKKGNDKIVVQAKRYSNKVGIEAVQQIIGAREYYKANKGMVVTNNYFTPNAINLAASSGIELWDRKNLLNIFYRSNGKDQLVELFGEKIIKKRVCKLCNSEMKLKNGKYGDFYGCCNFPKCRYTEKLIRK